LPEIFLNEQPYQESAMKGITVVIALIVLVVIFQFIRARGRAAQPAPRTVEEMIAHLSSEAVDIGKQNYGMTLDYSTESIEHVEEILGKLYDEYQADPNPRGKNGLIHIFGAYIGECIRRNHPGDGWPSEVPEGGTGYLSVHWEGGSSAVMGWCHKRLTNGPEDNVWHKYTMLREMHENGGTPPGALTFYPDGTVDDKTDTKK
jgi:hypothetical protein